MGLLGIPAPSPAPAAIVRHSATDKAGIATGRTLSLSEAQVIVNGPRRSPSVPVTSVGRCGAPSPTSRPQNTSAASDGLITITEEKARGPLVPGRYRVNRADGSSYRIDKGVFYCSEGRMLRLQKRREHMAERRERERQLQRDLFAC